MDQPYHQIKNILVDGVSLIIHGIRHIVVSKKEEIHPLLPPGLHLFPHHIYHIYKLHMSLTPACTLPGTSSMPSLPFLGMDNTLTNPPLKSSPNPYRSINILLGRAGCNRGSLSLVSCSICRSYNKCWYYLTVLDSPFSATSPLLGVLVIWTKDSSTSPPILYSDQ